MLRHGSNLLPGAMPSYISETLRNNLDPSSKMLHTHTILKKFRHYSRVLPLLVQESGSLTDMHSLLNLRLWIPQRQILFASVFQQRLGTPPHESESVGEPLYLQVSPWYKVCMTYYSGNLLIQALIIQKTQIIQGDFQVARVSFIC